MKKNKKIPVDVFLDLLSLSFVDVVGFVCIVAVCAFMIGTPVYYLIVGDLRDKLVAGAFIIFFLSVLLITAVRVRKYQITTAKNDEVQNGNNKNLAAFRELYEQYNISDESVVRALERSLMGSYGEADNFMSELPKNLWDELTDWEYRKKEQKAYRESYLQKRKDI